MLCEKCHLRPSTVSYHQIINGEEQWLYLCDECAKSYDFSNLFRQNLADFSTFVQDLFGPQLEGRTTQMPNKKRCPVCNRSFEEIAKSGKMGCDRCYSVFAAELRPTIEKLHGINTIHAGKLPVTHRHKKEVSDSERLDALKAALQEAIEKQAFEEAARLRDQIAVLEKQEGKQQ